MLIFFSLKFNCDLPKQLLIEVKIKITVNTLQNINLVMVHDTDYSRGCYDLKTDSHLIINQ